MNSQAITRVSIYALIAMLTSITNQFKEITSETLESMMWTDWSVLVITPVVSSLIAVRAFLDQSLTRDYKKQTPINLKELESVEK